jgi:2-enoate reductase
MMTNELRALLTPFQIGSVTIKNRFCMGPMGGPAVYGPRHEYSDAGIAYFTERAKGGFGLIFTGCMLPDMEVDPFNPGADQSPLTNPAVFRPAAVRLNERLRAYDAKMFAQISLGMGRNYPGLYSCSENEVFHFPDMKSPALTKDQLSRKIDQFIKAAGIIKNSDFSGIEVHALHWGYLLDQFAMSITNHREDEYGGCLENRLRVCRELIDGVKAECGSDFPVTMRLGLKSYMKGFNQASLTGEEESGRTLEEGLQICKLLESYGYDALSVDAGVYDSFYYACPPCYMPKGHGLKLYAAAKKAVKIPILAGSRMGDPVLCAKALAASEADAFVLSRPALADPCLPRKVEQGRLEKIRPCIGCNQGCALRLLEQQLYQTCAVNPQALRETTNALKHAVVQKKVVVVGGGVAGMEAARTATLCGHSVVLFEKTGVLGGELLAAGAHSFKSEVRQLNEWYRSELRDLKIPIRMHTEATPDLIALERPDAVILAVGACAVMPRSVIGIDHPKCVSCTDVLTGKRPAGQNVVIVGGGNVGCEIAMDFAMSGRKVTLIEALDNILKAGDTVPIQNDMMIRDMLGYYKVDVRTGCKLEAVCDDGAVVSPAKGGVQETLPCDTVVIAVGFRTRESMAPKLYGMGASIYTVGSGKHPSNILNAIGEAYEVANNL